MRLFRALSLLLLVSTYSFAAAPNRVSGAIDSGRMVRLNGNVHPKAQPGFDRGAVDPGFKLGHMTLVATPTASQKKAIDRLLLEQQNPKSANYHKWLTPEQYADRFGLSHADMNKITAWLKSQGFTVLNVARARNFVTFSGTAAQVASAFHTEIHEYNLDGEKHFANATAPSVPAALAGIVGGFHGLHNFWMKPNARKRLRSNYYDANFTFPDVLAPDDMSMMYDVKSLYATGIDGTGQSIAVIGQTDVYLADLTAFRTIFGLPAITGCTADANGLLISCTTSGTAKLQYVLVNADPGSPLSGDLTEADLDLEWSGAVARNAQIIYVNAPDPTGAGVVDAFYDAINNTIAPVISLSYGICEWDESGFLDLDEAELALANLNGITFVNSTGDAGSAACDYSTSSANNNLAVRGLAVSWPSSSQYATGVSGTATPYADFTTDFWSTANGANGGNALRYVPEQAWNDDDEIAAYCVANPGQCNASITSAKDMQTGFIGIASTGGGASNCATTNANGCSGGFPQPSWQTVSILGQASARFVPDVSLPASPTFPGYIFCTPQSEWGGTATTSTCAVSLFDAVDNWQSVIGGTSAAAPSFAGMVALLNHYLVHNGIQAQPGLGNINPALYQIAAYYPETFHPVNTGTNVVYCQSGTPTDQPVALRCPTGGSIGYDASKADATTGYNLVTGLGSVIASQLATSYGLILLPPDFTWSSSDASQTVVAGQTSAVYHFTATPAAATFAAAVTFGCTFETNAATLGCVFNPSSIAAGAGATPVQMTITSKGPGPAPAVKRRADKRTPRLPLALPIAGMVMAGLVGRKVSKYSAVMGVCVSLALLGLLMACGGSDRPPVSLTVSPTSASLWPNNAGVWPSSTQPFTATVTNTTNTTVTWSISPSTAGSIDASGLYTAPAIAAGLPPSVTVKATSQADSSKSASAAVTLKPATVPGDVNVTVTATEATNPKTFSVTLVVQ